MSFERIVSSLMMHISSTRNHDHAGQRKVFALRYVAEHAETARAASDPKQARASLREAKKKGTVPWEKVKRVGSKTPAPKTLRPATFRKPASHPSPQA
jgi:hypothetical protein